MSDTARLNVNVPRELYKELRMKALQQDTSVSALVIKLLVAYVNEETTT